MPFGRSRRRILEQLEFGKPEKHDLIFGGELHFDERIVARLRGNHRMNDADASDAAPMRIIEIRRLGARRDDADGFADEHSWTIMHSDPV